MGLSALALVLGAGAANTGSGTLVQGEPVTAPKIDQEKKLKEAQAKSGRQNQRVKGQVSRSDTILTGPSGLLPENGSSQNGSILLGR